MSRARFGDLVAAEWIKVRSLRSTPWMLSLVALFVVSAAAVAARNDYANFPSLSPAEQQSHSFALSDAFPLFGCLALMLVAAGTGAAGVVSEYSSGLIRTTMIAVPARGAVLLAKAVVQGLLWTVAGAVIAVLSFAVSQAILSGRDADVTVTGPSVLPALAAGTLLAPVCALIGLGLGVLIRHTATTMITSVVLLLVLPSIFPANEPWAAEIRHSMVFSAWQRLTEHYGPASAVGSLYPSFGRSWLVYALWPLVAFAIALIVLRRRDV
jgi:ABC-2 type transport system permease protein